MIKKEILIALMVISMFLISACDVYNTLYVKQSEIDAEALEAQEAVEVPEGDITIEIDTGVEEEVEIDFEDISVEEELEGDQ